MGPALDLPEGLAADGDRGAGSASAADEPTADWQAGALGEAALAEIVRGNIFSADRRRREPEPKPEGEKEEAKDEGGEPEPSEPKGPPPNPDRNLVLTGVSIHDGEPCAFIEDRGSGELRRVRQPGSIGRGRITAIGLEGVMYRADGETTRIVPGHTLAGGLPGAGADGGASVRSDSAGGEGGSSSQAEGGDGPSRAEILRRMRQRRANQREGESSGGSSP